MVEGELAVKRNIHIMIERHLLQHKYSLQHDLQLAGLDRLCLAVVNDCDITWSIFKNVTKVCRHVTVMYQNNKLERA